MSRLVDIVDLRKAVVAQPPLRLIEVYFFTHGQSKRVLAESVGRCHTLGKRLGTRHNHLEFAALVRESVKSLYAKYLRRRVLLTVLYIPLVA